MELAQITVANNPSILFTNPDTFLGTLTSRILLFSIVLAGLYFFVRFLMSAFGYLTSLGDPGKIQAQTTQLTNAIVGLLIVVSAYFLAQIIQTIFGLQLL